MGRARNNSEHTLYLGIQITIWSRKWSRKQMRKIIRKQSSQWKSSRGWRSLNYQCPCRCRDSWALDTLGKANKAHSRSEPSNRRRVPPPRHIALSFSTGKSMNTGMASPSEPTLRTRTHLLHKLYPKKQKNQNIFNHQKHKVGKKNLMSFLVFKILSSLNIVIPPHINRPRKKRTKYTIWFTWPHT